MKGKLNSLKIFECINGDPPDLYRHKIETLLIFEQGMDHYFKREFAMAALTFQKVVKKNKNDKTAKLFLNRAARLITEEISDDWEGIETMQLK